MNRYQDFKEKAFSALSDLAKGSELYAETRMTVGSADTEAQLKRQIVRKSIDTEWIEKIEYALPYLDLIIRNPFVAIEDEEEIMPVELTKRISDKTIKHLSQHTNLILDIQGDEVTPKKLLNVFHEETYLTYENKFVNTLLSRLCAFVDKRYKALVGGSGTEQNYRFDYKTEFDHSSGVEEAKSFARINVSIELSSPLTADVSEADKKLIESFSDAISRVKRISLAVNSYMASSFAQKLGRNYIRPPVIRTNAILKNKNLKECLTLWEYIEGCEKVGYSVVSDEFHEMPSDDYVSDIYSAVALQYAQFYGGIAKGVEELKILSEKHRGEVFPDFTPDISEEEVKDYDLFDSEYKKLFPVSALMNNKKPLSGDERIIRDAIAVALKADEILEEEAKRLAEEEAKRLAEEEAKRLAEEEAKRLAEEEAKRLAEEEAKRLAEEETEPLAVEEIDLEGIDLENIDLEHVDLEDIDEEALLSEVEEQLEDMESIEEEVENNTPAPSAQKLKIQRNQNVGMPKQKEFSFRDTPERGLVIPYTKEQYRALPRKKKKRILVHVRRIVKYNEIKSRLDLLKLISDPSVSTRIGQLEQRLAKQKGFLPNSDLWKDCIKK